MVPLHEIPDARGRLKCIQNTFKFLELSGFGFEAADSSVVAHSNLCHATERVLVLCVLFPFLFKRGVMAPSTKASACHGGIRVGN